MTVKELVAKAVSQILGKDATDLIDFEGTDNEITGVNVSRVIPELNSAYTEKVIKTKGAELKGQAYEAREKALIERLKLPKEVFEGLKGENFDAKLAEYQATMYGKKGDEATKALNDFMQAAAAKESEFESKLKSTIQEIHGKYALPQKKALLKQAIKESGVKLRVEDEKFIDEMAVNAFDSYIGKVGELHYNTEVETPQFELRQKGLAAPLYEGTKPLTVKDLATKFFDEHKYLVAENNGSEGGGGTPPMPPQEKIVRF